MELPNDISSVMQNASEYFMMNGSNIPEYQRNKIVELMGPGVSPVDFIVRVAEALYAVSGQLDNKGREIGAQAANLAAMNGWHGMTTRGLRIVNVMRRENGEEVSQPLSDDPTPLDSVIEPQVDQAPASDIDVPATEEENPE